MKRRVLAILAVFLLLCSLAIIVLACNSKHIGFRIAVWGNGLTGTRYELFQLDGTLILRTLSDFLPSPTGTRNWGDATSTSHFYSFGFGYDRWDLHALIRGGGHMPENYGKQCEYSMSLLWLSLLFALLAGCVGLPAWKQYRKQTLASTHRCKQCGYDLRATPHRCPECGAVPPASVAPMTPSPCSLCPTGDS